MSQSSFRFRVQVVNDGCDEEDSERIGELVQRLADEGASVSPLVHLSPNAGKGAAVYAGWQTRRDEPWLGFVDSDGSVSAEEVLRLLEFAWKSGEHSVVLASRRPVPGREIVRRAHRHRLGRCFAWAVTWSLRLPIHDTQCGLKWVPTSAFEAVESQLTERRFAFDIDLLSALRRGGARLIEEPISWRDSSHSTVRLWLDAPAMALALVRLVWKWRV
ncbi:glycosyltransferase [Nibricoccus sp. IMCC34717]|uniref:glycosyltransferase n=1 Tax=Nibricoccus sp. IMCC34717 TaxID=3034021 RepID=UPI0038508EC8